ncbi:hypothetical protein HF521_005206 [Silurus meridionalis]|uniref:WD repeat-containing protein 91 n=1 Tax=Silurus meridionalis TaxID=175797 RepID=A0A8T0AVP5_SILME|nr:hypothetical protein HF521_005206 [Silurus meridionalis]
MCVLSQGFGVEPACRKPYHSIKEFLLLFASGQKSPSAIISGGSKFLPHTGRAREEGNFSQSGLIFEEMQKLLIGPLVVFFNTFALKKIKDPTISKEFKMPSGAATSADTGGRQKRQMYHEKERKELFSKQVAQSSEKKIEISEGEGQIEGQCDTTDSATNQAQASSEGGGSGAEQPFIKLSQEEYGEHHSSIMHCKVDSSGRKVASLDVDGVVKVWSFNPILQTKATIMSKSPLLSLEWATKPDRLLLLGSGVGTVRLYDTEAKKNLYEMSMDDSHPRILSLACSPSGTSFVCSAAAPAARSGSMSETVPRLGQPISGQLLLWDTKTVKQQLQFALEPGPVAVNCIAFNHNGNLW